MRYANASYLAVAHLAGVLGKPLWVLLFLTLGSVSAYAQTNGPIDICSDKNGKVWYFSLGKTVFEIDNPAYSSDAPILQNVSPKYTLRVPDPLSPVGCFNNPQQLEEFSSINWPQLEPKDGL